MLSRLVYNKMVKFSFKSANGNSFTKGLDDMLKKMKISNYTVDYGIPASRNKNDAALHLAVNVMGCPEKNIASADCLGEPVQEKKEEVAKEFKKEFNNNIETNDFDEAVEMALNQTGFFVVEDCVKPSILSNGNGKWRELLPNTVKRKKGSNQRYITTGELFDCLGYEVKKK